MKILVVFLVVVAAASQVYCGDAAAKTKLLADMKKDYQKLVEPDDVKVKVGMSYICGQFEKESHRLKSRVFERYTWTDPRLAWDPTGYGGLAKITVEDKYIWTPEIRLLDAVGDTEVRDEVQAVILSTGTVYWIPPTTYKTICPSGDEEDTYHCTIRLSSWVDDADTVPLDIFEGGFDMKFALKACPWVATNVDVSIKTTKYDCCPKPYDSLVITFDLKERGFEDRGEEGGDGVTVEKVGFHGTGRHRRRFLHKEPACRWPKC